MTLRDGFWKSSDSSTRTSSFTRQQDWSIPLIFLDVVSQNDADDKRRSSAPPPGARKNRFGTPWLLNASQLNPASAPVSPAYGDCESQYGTCSAGLPRAKPKLKSSTITPSWRRTILKRCLITRRGLDAELPCEAVVRRKPLPQTREQAL